VTNSTIVNAAVLCSLISSSGNAAGVTHHNSGSEVRREPPSQKSHRPRESDPPEFTDFPLQVVLMSLIRREGLNLPRRMRSHCRFMRLGSASWTFSKSNIRLGTQGHIRPLIFRKGDGRCSQFFIMLTAARM
jgi:hypothetical protein